MNNKVKSALAGGVFLGILSVIPIVNAANLCCCAWAILGGVIASYLYIKSSPNPAQIGEGAMLGVFAGVIGAIIYFILGIPINLLTGNIAFGMMANFMRNINPDAAQILEQQAAIAQQQSVGQRLVLMIPGLLIWAIVLVIFAVIGGVIGVALFEKRKGGANTPPPPPNYGDAANSFQTRM